MPSLREVQLAFASNVLGRDGDSMNGLILEAGLTTEERMRVYRNNARIGFHVALRAAFPVIEQLGGADWFEAVAQRYQQQHPSRCGDLQYVGDRFVQFLHAELSGTQYEWFADVARLEWAYQEVLVAPQSPVLDIAALASLTPLQLEHLIFTPRAQLRLVGASTPVLDIWKAHQPLAESTDWTLDLSERQVLVLRRADHVEMRELPAAAACLLDAFIRALPLGPAQEQLASQHPDADFGAVLRQLMRFEALGPIRRFHH